MDSRTALGAGLVALGFGVAANALLGLAIGFGAFVALFTWLTTTLYQPLFAKRREGNT